MCRRIGEYISLELFYSISQRPSMAAPTHQHTAREKVLLRFDAIPTLNSTAHRSLLLKIVNTTCIYNLCFYSRDKYEAERALLRNQHARVIISARKTSHCDKHNKDLSRLHGNS